MNKGICKNAWCRATYEYEGDMPPGECTKCKSFDKEMSGGVSWVTKNYSDPRNDGKAHQIDYKTKYYSK